MQHQNSYSRALPVGPRHTIFTLLNRCIRKSPRHLYLNVRPQIYDIYQWYWTGFLAVLHAHLKTFENIFHNFITYDAFVVLHNHPMGQFIWIYDHTTRNWCYIHLINSMKVVQKFAEYFRNNRNKRKRAHKFIFSIDVIYSKHSTLHCWKVQIIIIIIMWPVRFAHSYKHRISQKCHCTYNYNAFAYTLRFSFVDFSFIISFLFFRILYVCIFISVFSVRSLRSLTYMRECKCTCSRHSTSVLAGQMTANTIQVKQVMCIKVLEWK